MKYLRLIKTDESLHGQYVIYDFDSFMADWGGFMGLILGYSLLAIYDDLVKIVMVMLNLSLCRGIRKKIATSVTYIVKTLRKLSDV